MSAFGSGYSNGQFWYGRSTGFPGFLYKKNTGVGGRRSTKMTPGGNITCNSATYLYNKYKPGNGGVGASSISNRRAKNRLATVCNGTGTTRKDYVATGGYAVSSSSQFNVIVTFTSNGTITFNNLTFIKVIIKLVEGPEFVVYDQAQPGITYPIILDGVSYLQLSFNLPVIESPKCFPCYMTLGQYSNYTHNPNGFIPCPST
jgi:hypothetical protein